MAGWVAAATVASAALSSRSASKAASTSAAATDRAGDVQREMFERNVELNAPFREAGITALNKLVPLATEYTPFSYNEFTKDPGYAFRMSEGMKGLERSAAARGGLLSGGTLKGIQRYGQDLGSQEYMNAFTRYGIERDRRLNPLQSLAGVGQTTSRELGAAGTQFANTMGDLGMNQANVAGNAQMSRASTYGNALNQLAYLGGRYSGGQGGYNYQPFGGGSGTFGEGDY